MFSKKKKDAEEFQVAIQQLRNRLFSNKYERTLLIQDKNKLLREFHLRHVAHHVPTFISDWLLDDLIDED